MPLITGPRTLSVIVLLALITLVWIPYQSDWYGHARVEPLNDIYNIAGESSPPSSPAPSTATTSPSIHAPLLTHITNNNVTYPRLKHEVLSAARARQFLDRMIAIRNEIFQPPEDGLQQINWWHMDRLEAYLKRAEIEGNLPPPIVVHTSWHWIPCAYGPCTTGEVQWIRPLIDIMKQQDNIFYLFSFWDHFRKEFKLLGNDLVTHAWVDDEHLVWCFHDTAGCIQSEENPDGVPPWKLFAFTFWGSKPNSLKWKSGDTPWSFNPLGSEWNLVPYQMPEGQFYLGYHYQGCQSLAYVPYEQRKDQIVILAKLSEYFHKWPAYDPATFYVQLKNVTGYEIVTNADVQEGYPIPEGLTGLGLVPQEEYDHQLANTKALLGIGKPIISPTPYASLCRGVPVIIPFNSYTHSHKRCTARPSPHEWCGFDEESHQHGPIAAQVGEPYVYTVDVAGDVGDIVRTIARAVNTPIEPFEPEDMRYETVRKRLLDYFAIDWRAHAHAKAKARLELEPFLDEWAKSNRDPSLH